ncbi:MAG: type II-A CRISPR-associated protein Csn2 [Tissierellia bacterium]|nr:type II-A CRISPR-associated protein Csn2 [Tissierellia bacterium]
MKLTYPDFQFKIDMVENCINKLIIENPSIFTTTVKEIVKQSQGEEGRFILSEENEIIRITDNVICIINPFAINFNDRKVLSKLYALLKNEVQNSEFWLLSNQVFSEMVQFIEQIVETVDYPITYFDEMDISALFKFMDIKIEVPEGDLVGQIIDYIKLMSQLLGYQVFVFVNLGSYLDFFELVELYKFAIYQKIHLLMIESYTNISRSSYEKIYIVDKDGCELY